MDTPRRPSAFVIRPTSAVVFLFLIFLLIAATAPRASAATFSKGYYGIDLWAFDSIRGDHTNNTGEYDGTPGYSTLGVTWPTQPNPIPQTWIDTSPPGCTLGFSYSGTGPVTPAYLDFIIPLGQTLALGDYRLYIRNFYRGQMDVIVGPQVFTNVPIIRYGWTDPVTVSINTAGDQTDRIIVRYYPNFITPNTGVPQTQSYICNGFYITTDFNQRPQGYNTIVNLVPSTPPIPLGPGVNYIEDGSFECGLGHGWGNHMNLGGTYPINDYVDTTASAPEGSRCIKQVLPLSGTKYQFPLEGKFYRLSPYQGGNPANPLLTYTMSCWMKGSRAASSVVFRLQGLAPDLTDDAFTLTATVPLTTTWQRYTVTGTIAALPGYLYAPRFTSNEDTPITVWVDGLQLEEGSSATTYKGRENFQVGFTPSSAQPGNIYYESTTANPTIATVGLRFDNPTLASTTSLDYEIYNYYDQLVAKGTQANVPLGGVRNPIGSFPLYAARRGIYRLVLNVTGATTKAELVYSVIPPNKNLASDYDGTLACDGAFTPRALAIIKRQNYNWIMSKTHARWVTVEPTNFTTEPAWTAAPWKDQDLINARNAKLKLMLQFMDYQSPAWVEAFKPAGYPTGATWPAVDRANYLVAWNDFLSHTVNRYKTWCKNWEIGNEPNASFRNEDYAEILKQSYDTIKAADSGATVCGFSGGGFTQSWYDSIFSLLGGSTKYDKVSTHLYNNDATLHASFKTWAAGHGNKPTWNTETGLTCNSMFTTLPTYDSVTYSNDHLTQMQGNWTCTKNSVNNYLTTMGVSRMERYFYYFNRFTNSSPTQPTRRGGSGKDTMEYDGSQRANAVGLSVASSLIDGNTFYNTFTGAGFTAYLWTKAGGGSTGFIWAPVGVVTIPTGGTITFRDVIGNSLQADGVTQYRPADGPILFTSTAAPSTAQTELGNLSVNTASSNALPVAFMSGAPTGNVKASTAYKILLSGRDCDEEGQSLTAGAAGVELKIDNVLINPAPTGVGVYNYTTPTSGTHTLSFRVKDNEGSWSNAVTSTFTVTTVPAFKKFYSGLSLWQFDTTRGNSTNLCGEYFGTPSYTGTWPAEPNPIPAGWSTSGAGCTGTLSYSGTGPLPSYDFVVPLGQTIPPGTYNVFVKNFYLDLNLQAIIASESRPLTVVRYGWNPAVTFTVTGAGTDRVILRYTPSLMTPDNGVVQTQNIIVQGFYITSTLTETISGYNTITP